MCIPFIGHPILKVTFCKKNPFVNDYILTIKQFLPLPLFVTVLSNFIKMYKRQCYPVYISYICIL